MSTKRTNITWRLHIAFIITLIYVCRFPVHSQSNQPDNTQEKEVGLFGRWEETTNRDSPMLPFCVTTNGYIITIQNTHPNCDITICITNDAGQTVIEEIILKDDTSYIVSPINTLADGDYILELRNAYGEYVYGYFCKKHN